MILADELVTGLTSRVWYNSQLDENALFKSIMVSSNRGAIGTINFTWDSYTLPDNNNRYLLLSLGVVPFAKMGLSTIGKGWVSTATLIDLNTFFICFALGRRFNTAQSFVQVTERNEVLIALEYFSNSFISTLNPRDLFVRFYSNIFFSLPPDRIGTGIKVLTYITGINSLDYLSFVRSFSDYTKCLIFRNGLLCPSGFPTFNQLNKGDIIESIYDPSITESFTQLVTDLPLYFSTLDNVNKLIFSFDEVTDNQFVADTEFFIIGTKSNGDTVGAYYPRAELWYIRPLTYKDYGLNSHLLQNTANTLSQFSDVGELTNLSVKVIRRTSGLVRYSVNGANYINDLMNLPVHIRQQCLTGVNANLPLWQASTLETCTYNKFIQHLTTLSSYSDYYGTFSRKEAIEYLEYPTKLSTGNWEFPLIGQTTGQFVTFDSTGKTPTISTVSRLTQQMGYPSGNEPFYLPFTESVSQLDIQIPLNDTSVTVVPNLYEFLAIYENSNGLNVATRGIDYTVYDDGILNTSTITWSNTMHGYNRYIFSCTKGIAFTHQFTVVDAMNGIDVYNENPPTIEIGLGSLLVWCNGDYLVYGLDYILYNTKIYLSSKRRTWTDSFTLTVLYVGVPDVSLTYQDSTIFGFTKYNSVLIDGKYDLIAFRDKMIVVDGAFYTLNQILEKENYQDIRHTTIVPFGNGLPYAIIDRPQFSRNDILNLLTKTKAAENEDDLTISAFITALDPQPIPTSIIVIPRYYEVVSVMMNKLIHDIVTFTLTGITKSSYTEDEIYQILIPYLWMRHIDLTQFNLDSNYVIFSPSWDVGPFTVSLAEFNFLTAVNSLVLFNKVQRLDTYLTIL